MQHRHQLSPEEKTLVCNVYDYFVAEAKEGRSGGRNSCQRTKEATRFGKNTIFRVLRARNINPDTDFVESTAPSARGRKKLYNESDLNVIVRENHIDFEPSWFIPQLLELVKAHKSKLNYVSHRIANEQGHYLLDTPPYRPELQHI
ncbi:hypothetical protein PC113_g6022 [Phytophthora cactorum]|uniref:Tc1-like transposase DDE domain-containing protein n=1 Tax=Phytophthora cactorum TaxID=29920 RepID=A0A8T0ZK78_9STRA|nr:hypothetical protein PC113_g6022 [Phytophthora cactorum]KAG3095899.1 hypothetical protein PC122_g5147 [Phytophthora cactorum]